ncbi:MAG: response regulator [Candidatus Komeilibacteria bacterium]
MNTPKTQTIMVVENDTVQQKLEKLLLEQGGYKVLLARDADEAREILLKEQVDLVTTAIMLPLESGFNLIRGIRNSTQFKDIPIVCISCVINEHNQKKLEELGCSASLIKPYDIKDLLNIINGLLRK